MLSGSQYDEHFHVLPPLEGAEPREHSSGSGQLTIPFRYRRMDSQPAVRTVVTHFGTGIPIEPWDWGPSREAPEGYYGQNAEEQGVFEGMELDPHEHMSQVPGADIANTGYTYLDGPDTHMIHIDRGDEGVSTLAWSGHWNKKPGEIRSIKSARPGDGTMLYDLANRMAAENSHITAPRHSSLRTNEGLEWSRKMMRKRGEEEW